MNLETEIEKRLWTAIQTPYEAGHYSNAILDAIHFLGSVIREKAGLESDGVQLVGEALGGQDPKIKVNKLQTESEKNVQRGVEFFLRGLFQAIRNPRSHEKHADTKREADRLLVFIGYLIEVIDKSKGTFSLDSFMARIFDPDYPANKRYSELLVEEIPSKQRLIVFGELLHKLRDADGAKLRYFVSALVSGFTEEQEREALEAVSNLLKTTSDDNFILEVIRCMPERWWAKYEEITRIRIENKLIGSIRSGRYDKKSGQCLKGGLGTCATRIASHFAMKTDLGSALSAKLASSNRAERLYVTHMFSSTFFNLFAEPTDLLARIIRRQLKAGDADIKDFVDTQIEFYDQENWAVLFSSDLKSFKPKSTSGFEDMDDDIPF